jgi:pilus assembly protein CpaE
VITAGVVVTDPQFREAIAATLQTLGVHVAFAVANGAREAHRMEASNPDVLVLDFGLPSAHAVMAELKSLAHPVTVIAAHTASDPDAILAALRSGAREFLYPPLNEHALRAVIESVERDKIQMDARRNSSKALGFLSAAGGCGATTTACHVAAELRRMEVGDIAVLDFDLFAGVSGFWFGANSSYSVLDAVHGLGRLDESLWKGLVSTVQPHLDVLPAPSEIPLGGLPGNRGFSEVLRFARCRYDWVIADLAQHLTPLSLSLIEDLDTVYVVTTPEVAPLLQTRRIIQRMIQQGYLKDRIKALVSRVHKDQELSVDELEKMIGVPVEAVLPNDNREIADAHADGRLVSPRSDLGKRFAQVATKASGRQADEPRASKFSLFRLRAEVA